MKTTQLIATAMMLCVGAMATAAEHHLHYDFSNGIARGLSTENANGAALNTNLYRHLQANEGWFAAPLRAPHNNVALTPTANAEGAPTDNWLVLPYLDIDSPDALLTWEARSMHKPLAETYEVLARVADTDEWTLLYACPGENYAWTRHAVSLGQFQGSSIAIAFRATTEAGFMLAIDNVDAGELEAPILVMADMTQTFVGCDQPSLVRGAIANYGSPTTEGMRLVLSGIADDQWIDMPALAPGESWDFTFEVLPELNVAYDYKLALHDADGREIDIDNQRKGLLCCSYMPRTHFLDHFTATWCVNCPPAQLITEQWKRDLGDQILVVDAHVAGASNEVLANADYTHYFSDFVFGIPRFDLNHSPVGNGLEYCNSTCKAKIIEPTYAAVEAQYAVMPDGEIAIASTFSTAIDLDNSYDRYRVGYLVLADFHDPDNFYYKQSNSTWATNDEEFYYHSSVIMPQMMWYENVPVEASTAKSGVHHSLPADIDPGEDYAHAFTLRLPADFTGSNVKVVAMAIDTDDGSIMNCCYAAENPELGALGAIEADSCAGEARMYDAMGRPVANPAPGSIVIVLRDGVATKLIVK